MNYALYSIRNVQSRPTRGWLTLLGIVIGIATIVALLALSDGLQNSIESLLLDLGAQNIRIAPGNTRGPPIGVPGLTDKDAEAVGKVKGVEYAAGQIIQTAEVELGREKQFRNVFAVDSKLSEKFFPDLNIKMADGRLFTSGEKDSVLIGSIVAKKIFENEIRPRNKLIIQGREFKVVGIFAETGAQQIDGIIYIPLESAKELFDKPDTINAILAHAADGEDVTEVGRRIEKELKDFRNNDNFEVFTPEQLLRRIKGVLGMISVVLAGIGAISIIVGGIGIMNSMFTSVLERTRDIGVMKAIGASNKSILFMFLIESAVIGAVGGAIGVLLGYGISYFMTFIAKQAGFGMILIIPRLKTIAFGILFSSAIGVASGLLPAYFASRTVPVESLRYE